MNKQELLKCIGCGFCLNVCPGYAAHRDEAHSPRGIVRILLYSESRGAAPPAHLVKSCIDCLKCKDACPVSLDFETAFGLAALTGKT